MVVERRIWKREMVGSRAVFLKPVLRTDWESLQEASSVVSASSRLTIA